MNFNLDIPQMNYGMNAINTGSNQNIGMQGMDFGNIMGGGQQPQMNNGIFSQASMFGGKNSTGWMNPMLGAAQSGVQLWQGMQQLDMAREQMAFQKEAFAKNWANQVQTANTRMADRQNARTSANPYAYESTSSYMAKNKVS